MTRTHVTINEDAARLDRVLVSYLDREVSRSQVTRWFKEERILDAQGSPVKAGLPVKAGDTFTVDIPEEHPTHLIPESVPLDIVYEDTDILIINKPQGMVVHPGAGNWTGTLANALLGYTSKLAENVAQPMRPGIVHRIDKDTSGLLVVARTSEAHRSLSDALQKRQIHRHYTACVYGQLQETQGLIDGPLARDPKHRKRMAIVQGGRSARTHYRVVDRMKHSSLLALTLETGRTHQIRAHLQAIGHPVLADPVYAPGRPDFGMTGQALHAHELILPHPTTHEVMTFRAPLPTIWLELLKQLAVEEDQAKLWVQGEGITWPEIPEEASGELEEDWEDEA